MPIPEARGRNPGQPGDQTELIRRLLTLRVCDVAEHIEMLLSHGATPIVGAGPRAAVTLITMSRAHEIVPHLDDDEQLDVPVAATGRQVLGIRNPDLRDAADLIAAVGGRLNRPR